MRALAKISAAHRGRIPKKDNESANNRAFACGTSVAARIRTSSQYTFDVGQESIVVVYDDEAAYSRRKAKLCVLEHMSAPSQNSFELGD